MVVSKCLKQRLLNLPFSDWSDNGRLIGLKADGSPIVRPTPLPPGGLSDEDRASERTYVPQKLCVYK